MTMVYIAGQHDIFDFFRWQLLEVDASFVEKGDEACAWLRALACVCGTTCTPLGDGRLAATAATASCDGDGLSVS